MITGADILEFINRLIDKDLLKKIFGVFYI
jgi:hypothetical protein